MTSCGIKLCKSVCHWHFSLIIMPKKVLTKPNVKNIENNFSHTLRKEGKQKKKNKKNKTPCPILKTILVDENN